MPNCVSGAIFIYIGRNVKKEFKKNRIKSNKVDIWLLK